MYVCVQRDKANLRWCGQLANLGTHLTIFCVLKDFQNKKLERKEHIVGSNEKDCGRQDWGQAANCELLWAVLEGARRRGRRGRWFEAKRKQNIKGSGD